MERVIIKEDREYAVTRALRALRLGHVIVFPTDTVYGVGGDALRSGMAARVRQAKGRVETKYFPWLVANLKMAKRHGRFSWGTSRLAKKVWPGPTTLVVRNVSSEGTVGLRVPKYPWLNEVIGALGRPIIGTSANQSGERGAQTADEAIAALPNVDVVFDGGTLHGEPSQVIDCTVSPQKVLRLREETKNKIR